MSPKTQLILFRTDLENGDENEEEDTRPMSRQALLSKIRQKKEAINKLRSQAWPMARKRRTLKLATKYLEQNESKVSKMHLYKEALGRGWRAFGRWIANKADLLPWEGKIKRIESKRFC
jgi:hypothetical protein